MLSDQFILSGGFRKISAVDDISNKNDIILKK